LNSQLSVLDRICYAGLFFHRVMMQISQGSTPKIFKWGAH